MKIRAVVAAVIDTQHAVPARDEVPDEARVKGTARLEQEQDRGKMRRFFGKDVARIDVHTPLRRPSAEKTEVADDHPLLMPLRERHDLQGKAVVKVLPKRYGR